MEFNPNNHVVRLLIQGMAFEEKGKTEDAGSLFHEAWTDATNNLEKFIAAHAVARHTQNVTERVHWFETALQFAKKIDDPGVVAAFPALYRAIAACNEDLGEHEKAKMNSALADALTDTVQDPGPYYHGTKADLQVGDLLIPGNTSNYNTEVVMNHIYFTALLNGAGLAATLAKGEGEERVYIVEPTGSFEHDPNVTNKKFPGNLTRSYRSTAPLKIVGEVIGWEKLTPEERQKWQEKLANNQGDIIN